MATNYLVEVKFRIKKTTMTAEVELEAENDDHAEFLAIESLKDDGLDIDEVIQTMVIDI